jgi:hypothetical protein
MYVIANTLVDPFPSFGHILPIARWSGQLGKLVVLLELIVTRFGDFVPRRLAVLGLRLGKAVAKDEKN